MMVSTSRRRIGNISVVLTWTRSVTQRSENDRSGCSATHHRYGILHRHRSPWNQQHRSQTEAFQSVWKREKKG